MYSFEKKSWFSIFFCGCNQTNLSTLEVAKVKTFIPENRNCNHKKLEII